MRPLRRAATPRWPRARRGRGRPARRRRGRRRRRRPITPASTSPVPAVASHGVPDSTITLQPSGRATTVAAALQHDDGSERPRRSRRRRRDARRRSRRRRGRGRARSRRRACSRACGVTMRGAGAPRARSSAPASTTTGCGPDRMRAQRRGLGIRSVARHPSPTRSPTPARGPAAATVSGRRASTSPVGPLGPEVADHADAGAPRRLDAEHRGAGVRVRPGADADHASGILVVGGRWPPEDASRVLERP